MLQTLRRSGACGSAARGGAGEVTAATDPGRELRDRSKGKRYGLKSAAIQPAVGFGSQ